jgi:hypothetical protein
MTTSSEVRREFEDLRKFSGFGLSPIRSIEPLEDDVESTGRLVGLDLRIWMEVFGGSNRSFGDGVAGFCPCSLDEALQWRTGLRSIDRYCSEAFVPVMTDGAGAFIVAHVALREIGAADVAQTFLRPADSVGMVGITFLGALVGKLLVATELPHLAPTGLL